jgi:hypothetical protein
MLYLAIAGLVVLVSAVTSFTWAAWTLRSVWVNVYVLHDAGRSDAERVDAAYGLSRDPRLNQRQFWDISLRKTLPPLARYVLAEALTAEAAESDPRGFGNTVVKSEGWPVWLRILLTRPMAYSAALDLPVPRESLTELAKNTDRATAPWAWYALAAGSEGDSEFAAALRRDAASNRPEQGLAAHLVAALESAVLEERLKHLDDATRWLRTHHPEAVKLWEGWKIEGDHLVPASGR